jgi:hypothetical protein
MSKNKLDLLYVLIVLVPFLILGTVMISQGQGTSDAGYLPLIRNEGIPPTSTPRQPPVPGPCTFCPTPEDAADYQRCMDECGCYFDDDNDGDWTCPLYPQDNVMVPADFTPCP